MELSTIKYLFEKRKPSYYAALEELGVLDKYLTNVMLYHNYGEPLKKRDLHTLFTSKGTSIGAGFLYDQSVEGDDFWYDIEKKVEQLIFK